jgi:hypothetical protein
MLLSCEESKQRAWDWLQQTGMGRYPNREDYGEDYYNDDEQLTSCFRGGSLVDLLASYEQYLIKENS